MLLTFALLLLSMIVGILVSVYSLFVPFLENLWDISDFNIAYYSSISSIERWLLVAKYKQPGIMWSGGWIDSDYYGQNSDVLDEEFWRTTSEGNGMRWSINSRTDIIPSSWAWNVEYLLASIDSKYYNALGYNQLVNFVLSVDNSSNYYTWSDASDITANNYNIQWTLRLPPKVYDTLWGSSNANLCNAQVEECDPDGDRLHDDIIVNRTVKWKYNGDTFRILPTKYVAYYSNPAEVISNLDNTMRESLINSWSLWNHNIIFNDYQISSSNGGSIGWHSVISQNTWIAQIYFQNLFATPTSTDLQLNLGLVSLLKSNAGTVYPFLEYQFDFGGDVADMFYTIHGNGRVGDYDVQIIVKKPTLEQSAVGEFTVMF